MPAALRAIPAASTATALWGPKSVKSNSNSNSKNDYSCQIRDFSMLPITESSSKLRPDDIPNFDFARHLVQQAARV